MKFNGAEQQNTYSFINYYRCNKCNESWNNYWSYPHNEDCPACENKNIKPIISSKVA